MSNVGGQQMSAIGAAKAGSCRSASDPISLLFPYSSSPKIVVNQASSVGRIPEETRCAGRRGRRHKRCIFLPELSGQRVMTSARISDQLRYMTVRILTSKNPTTIWTGSGTGFLYLFQKEDKTAPFLVTNKHVLEDASVIGLNFHVTLDNNETPLSGSGRLISFPADKVPIIRHPDPDVDLAAIAILPIHQHAIDNEGWQPFTKCLCQQNLPPPDMIKDFGAVEDVIMVGYPTGIVDAVNNFPIIRRGITSTPYFANYQGKREFLADIPVYGGSSGSPIFVMNEGSWSTPNGIVMGTRFALIGVLYAGHTETINGQIVAEPVPTNLTPVAKVTHIINLGLCIKSALIEDLADQIPGW